MTSHEKTHIFQIRFLKVLLAITAILFVLRIIQIAGLFVPAPIVAEQISPKTIVQQTSDYDVIRIHSGAYSIQIYQIVDYKRNKAYIIAREYGTHEAALIKLDEYAINPRPPLGGK